MPVTPIIGVRISWRHRGEERRLRLVGLLGGLAGLDGDLLGVLAAATSASIGAGHLVERAGDPLELGHAR